MKDFAALQRKKSRLVVGLMSGTSADGIDAALVRIRGSGPGTQVATLASVTVPYPKDVRAAVLRLASARAPEVAQWNFALGELFAQATLAVIAKSRRAVGEIDLVGSHGQTVVHLPRRATLQIGEPAVIAERTGIPVVADFRVGDVAAGGEGAPLVPWVDWLLLRPDRGARLAQNLGGVGNVALVTQRAADVIAFDTGPANAPIDAAVRLATDGLHQFDRAGRLAASGRVDEAVVKRLLRHAYFGKSPPKSLDRDTFGAALVARLAAARPDSGGADLVATVTEFVARSIADAYERHLPRRDLVDVVVSGGGVHNRTLMKRLAALVAPLPVRSSAELGIDPDAKEAVAFAVLANETISGRPGNLPRVTGARRPVILGKLVLSGGPPAASSFSGRPRHLR